ncbi:uracil-DNA glycosylase [Clostridium sp. 19966]|uniref:uracil-DNA glycosylase n=1 Tax=Clostridium sp. 19966 TaxID=2768166 RepID=UPI0028E08DE8|nr:uracil-DNA glycosylase [Clostridium sp. 19966]MDT8719496.1 uracil-DNA glycosylase [Clostridium sp. 19966]
MKYTEIIEKIKYIAENYKEEPTGGWITGDGPIPADIMFVGEAPGKTEIEQGKPFVGMAGKTFEGYLKTIGIERKDIRITNSCFFRPIKIKEGKNGRESVSNRTPKTSEVELFRSVLDEEILLANPKIIVTLGNIPLKRLTDFKSIGDCHGSLVFNDSLKKYVFPMYHPSALTYNRNEAFKNMYEEDWQKLGKALKEV